MQGLVGGKEKFYKTWRSSLTPINLIVQASPIRRRSFKPGPLLSTHSARSRCPPIQGNVGMTNALGGVLGVECAPLCVWDGTHSALQEKPPSNNFTKNSAQYYYYYY